MGLQKKALSGLFWTFSQIFSVKLIGFVVQVVLARILLPSEFGMIAMLTVFVSIGNSLVDRGLTASLIRTPKPDQKDYSTVFFVNLLGSVIIYLILFFTAPYIASFYKQELLTDVIRVYTLSFVIQAFAGVHIAKLTKDMNFKTQMTIQIPSLIGGGILGIILGYSGYGVWSLVGMNLLQSFLTTVQYWIRADWRPNFIFDRERFKSHFNFGYKLGLAGLLNAIYDNIYHVVIGKFFSVTQLGFYSRASNFQQLPIKSISNALNKVTYPMFASIQHDNEKLKQAYRKVMQQALFLVAPFMAILSVIAEPLFRFLLTEKWVPAASYFQILCIAGILYPLQYYNLNILKVKGRSDLVLRLNVLKKITLTIGIAIAIPFGIKALLIVRVISSVIGYVYNTYYSGHFIQYPISEQLKDIFPILLLSISMGTVILLLDNFLGNTQDLLRILIGVSVGIGEYWAISYLLRLKPYLEFKSIIHNRLLRRAHLIE